MRIAIVGVSILALAGCQTYGNDEMARYLQRKDTVTLSAGDGMHAAMAQQVLTPWPPGVGDRRIPMEGSRAAAAMRNYGCDNAQSKTNTQATTASAGGVSVTASKSETKKDC